MTTGTLSIRPAILEDTSIAVELIYQSLGKEADWIFCHENGPSARKVMARLFRHKKNRISHSFAYIASWNNQDAGLLLAFPGSFLKGLDRMTALVLFRVLGPAAAMRIIKRQSDYGDLLEATPKDYYISNVAVRPEFQGKGIGGELMLYGENLAKAAGFLTCSLIVTYGHEQARKLYEKLGYTVAETYDFNHPQIAEGSGGYFRMVKVLAEEAG